MSAPIAISPDSHHSPAHNKPSGPDNTQTHLGHHPTASSSSTISSSSSGSALAGPQTPFSPSFSMSPTCNTTGLAPGSGNASSPNQNSSILKWASSFASLGKSPTSPPPILGSAPLPIIHNPSSSHSHDHDHDHHEGHDAFEFGDISDLNKSSWTGHGRRAMSMSNPSGVGAAAGPPGGISAMLSGFGSVSPSAGSGGLGKDGVGSPGGLGLSAPVGSPPLTGGGAGVIAENAARGQGLLRRLSLGGAGRGRPQMMSPPNPSIALPPSSAPSAPSVPAPQPTSAGPTTAAPGGTDDSRLQAGSFGQRGRRYSENPGAAGKKRGVSPVSIFQAYEGKDAVPSGICEESGDVWEMGIFSEGAI